MNTVFCGTRLLVCVCVSGVSNMSEEINTELCVYTYTRMLGQMLSAAQAGE